jgi:hypothetical protein
LELRVLNELKSEKYNQMLSNIKSSQNDLNNRIMSYSELERLPKLEEFIEKYQDKNLEYELANLLDSALPHSRSFVKTSIDRVRQVAQDQDVDKHVTPLTLMYDFYLFMIGKVIEANNLLLYAVRLRNQIKYGEQQLSILLISDFGCLLKVVKLLVVLLSTLNMSSIERKLL